MTIPFQRILIIPTIPFPVTSLPYSFVPYSVPYCDPTHTPQTFHLKHLQITPLFPIQTPRVTSTTAEWPSGFVAMYICLDATRRGGGGSNPGAGEIFLRLYFAKIVMTVCHAPCLYCFPLLRCPVTQDAVLKSNSDYST